MPELRALATEWRRTTAQLSEARLHRTTTPIPSDLKAQYAALTPRVLKLRRDFDSENRARVYASILHHAGFRPVIKHHPDGATVRAF